MEKFRTMEPGTPSFTEQEELRGLSRSVAEIEWLMIILVTNTPLVAVGGLLNSTVSIGIASCPADGNSLNPLLAHASGNLYVAKLGGRNQVVQSLA